MGESTGFDKDSVQSDDNDVEETEEDRAFIDDGNLEEEEDCCLPSSRSRVGRTTTNLVFASGSCSTTTTS